MVESQAGSCYNEVMKNFLVRGRNAILGGLYRGLLKPLLFLFDPEDVHNLFISIGRGLGRFSLTRFAVKMCFGYGHLMLEQEILGLKFKNPIGLAAGFDKDAELTDIISAVGFGFMEVGSVTGEPCAGNPRPRLWRLPRSRSLVVWYGLKNLGSRVIGERLRGKLFRLPIGVSVAPTNCSANLEIDRAIDDYAKAFSAFAEISSYLTINISCPNAAGGQPFNNPANLDRLLTRLDQQETDKPVLLKMSPDLTEVELDDIIKVARSHRVHGFICSNLTKQWANPPILDQGVSVKGGVSGKVAHPLALAQIRRVYRQVGGEMLVIGCGGIFTATDVYEMIRAGASLVQLITGMIFEGPQLMSDINLGLVKLLQRDGFSSLRSVVGIDNLAG